MSIFNLYKDIDTEVPTSEVLRALDNLINMANKTTPSNNETESAIGIEEFDSMLLDLSNLIQETVETDQNETTKSAKEPDGLSDLELDDIISEVSEMLPTSKRTTELTSKILTTKIMTTKPTTTTQPIIIPDSLVIKTTTKIDTTSTTMLKSMEVFDQVEKVTLKTTEIPPPHIQKMSDNPIPVEVPVTETEITKNSTAKPISSSK